MPRHTIQLPEDVTTKVYRLVAMTLQADPILRATIRRWQTWDGEPGDITPPTPESAPWIGLTPRPNQETVWSPEAHQGFLDIEVRALIRGTCIDDVLNLWGAIRGALSPYTKDTAGVPLMTRLQLAGAPQGYVHFTQPAIDRDPESGQDGAFYATGMLRIEYRAFARS